MPVHASLGSLAHECALRGAGPCSSCIMFRVCLVSKQGNQPPKAIMSGQLLWRVPLPWLPPLISAQVLWAVLGELRPSWCWPCPPTPRARAACEATAAAQTVGEGMFQRGREVGGSWWLHPSSMWPVPGELGDCPCWLVPLPCPVPSVHSSFWDWLLSAPHCCPFQRNANWDIDSHECPGGRDSLGCLEPRALWSFLRGPGGPGSGAGGMPSSIGKSSLGGAGHSAQVFGLKVLFMQQHLRKGLLATPFPAAPP